VPTYKPVLVALSIMTFFTGLIMRSHAHGLSAGQPVNMTPSLVVMVIGGLFTAITLLWWLFSPLEEEH
jgi:hypothetical protein